VVGLGYVGWPLAEAFARKKMKVVGYDIDAATIDKLRSYSLSLPMLSLSSNASDIREADFVIVAVPTPISEAKLPDLSYIKSAMRIVGSNLKKGGTVILESTVYPGVTEEIVVPILERESGWKCGVDFKVGYSPERINPGDPEHTIDKVFKVVAGMDGESTKAISDLYKIVTPFVFEAKDMRVAEAAKVIENIQRDLNIALMNELSVIFCKIGLNTADVLAAARTKWNFLKEFAPGLVGGHCIPVDPFYLTYKAQLYGYQPQVILAGRSINDNMPKYVAELAVRALNDAGKVIKGSKVLLLGLTYKEGVSDTRETPARGIISELRGFGVDLYGYDPMLTKIEEEFGIKAIYGQDFTELDKLDAVIWVVGHKEFNSITLEALKTRMSENPVLVDVRGHFDRDSAEREGFVYRSL
jgi:UDPglucose 6-dehydrogenase/UDP-N-acetyl-D-galactosamine dehydrogenase